MVVGGGGVGGEEEEEEEERERERDSETTRSGADPGERWLCRSEGGQDKRWGTGDGKREIGERKAEGRGGEGPHTPCKACPQQRRKDVDLVCNDECDFGRLCDDMQEAEDRHAADAKGSRGWNRSVPPLCRWWPHASLPSSVGLAEKEEEGGREEVEESGICALGRAAERRAEQPAIPPRHRGELKGIETIRGRAVLVEGPAPTCVLLHPSLCDGWLREHPHQDLEHSNSLHDGRRHKLVPVSLHHGYR